MYPSRGGTNRSVPNIQRDKRYYTTDPLGSNQNALIELLKITDDLLSFQSNLAMHTRRLELSGKCPTGNLEGTEDRKCLKISNTFSALVERVQSCND